MFDKKAFADSLREVAYLLKEAAEEKDLETKTASSNIELSCAMEVYSGVCLSGYLNSVHRGIIT